MATFERWVKQEMSTAPLNVPELTEYIIALCDESDITPEGLGERVTSTLEASSEAGQTAVQAFVEDLLSRWAARKHVDDEEVQERIALQAADERLKESKVLRGGGGGGGGAIEESNVESLEER